MLTWSPFREWPFVKEECKLDAKQVAGAEPLSWFDLQEFRTKTDAWKLR
jgi:hypothetical protein